MIGLHAAALLGCAFVPVNASLAGKAEEVKHMLSTAQVKYLMVWDDTMAKEITKAMGPQMEHQMRMKIICNESSNRENSGPKEGLHYLTGMISGETSQPPSTLGPSYEANLKDVTLIIFISGTTSHPKAQSFGVARMHHLLRLRD